MQKASFAASFPKPMRLDRSGGALAPSPLSKTWNQANPPGGSVGSLLYRDDAADLGAVAVVDVHARDVDVEVERLPLDDLVIHELAGDASVRVLVSVERKRLIHDLHAELVRQRDRPVDAAARGGHRARRIRRQT